MTALQPRRAAFDILAGHHDGADLKGALARVLRDDPGNHPSDRALCQELVYGTLRHRNTLDHLLSAFLRHPRLERPLRELLRLGAYQLVYLDRIPAPAAIHEMVSLARAVAGERRTGFVNAVLRNLARVISAEPAGVAGPPRHAPDALPLPGGRTRRFTRPLLPDPATDPSGFLALAYSHPRWLVTRWRARYDETTLLAALAAGNERPHIVARVNPTRASTEVLRARLDDEGYASRPGTEPGTLVLEHAGAIDRLAPFQEGLFQVQDPAGLRAVARLDLAAGDRVLDLCAAPGGKATAIAERVGPTGLVLAADIHPERIQRVVANARRLGLANLHPLVMDATRPATRPGRFPHVLVDAPCTNTGVLARRPDARWRIRLADVDALARLQAEILRGAASLVAPGGRLVYAVCSLEPEEGPARAACFLQQRPGWRLVTEEGFIPGPKADGGYLAVLRREDEAKG